MANEKKEDCTMEQIQMNSPEFSQNLQGKNKHFRTQMQRVFKAFYECPKTMLMVSTETGVLRANICRYVAEWERKNQIGLVRHEICPISKHVAGFYTTNPNWLKKTFSTKATIEEMMRHGNGKNI